MQKQISESLTYYNLFIFVVVICFFYCIIKMFSEHFSTITYDITNTNNTQSCTTDALCDTKQYCNNGTCNNFEPFCFTHGKELKQDPHNIDLANFPNNLQTYTYTCDGPNNLKYDKTITCNSGHIVADKVNNRFYCA